jgi:hypothetical protein
MALDQLDALVTQEIIKHEAGGGDDIVQEEPVVVAENLGGDLEVNEQAMVVEEGAKFESV